MKITIANAKDRDGRTEFDVQLWGSGEEPFLTIRGCRIVNGSKGAFVSWPARKQQDGKYWNHVRASEQFGAAVLERALAETKRPSAKAADDGAAW